METEFLKNRKPGFYWVKIKKNYSTISLWDAIQKQSKDWVVCYFDGLAWNVPGFQWQYEDSEFEEIEDFHRIEHVGRGHDVDQFYKD